MHSCNRIYWRIHGKTNNQTHTYGITLNYTLHLLINAHLSVWYLNGVRPIGGKSGVLAAMPQWHHPVWGAVNRRIECLPQTINPGSLLSRFPPSDLSTPIFTMLYHHHTSHPNAHAHSCLGDIFTDPAHNSASSMRNEEFYGSLVRWNWNCVCSVLCSVLLTI